MALTNIVFDAGIDNWYYDSLTGIMHLPSASIHGEILFPYFVQTGVGAGTTNNVNLGTDDWTIVLISAAGAATLTGWASGSVGKMWALVSIDAVNTITLKHQNAGSTAANRFTLPGATDLALGPGQAAIFYRLPQAYGSHICLSSSAGGGGGGAISDGDKGDITVSGTGAVWTIDNGVVSPAKATAALKKEIRTWVWDGGGIALTSGDNSIGYNRIPQDSTYTIKRWTLMAKGAGSCTVDLFADTFANYPPNPADTICGGNKPAIGAGTSAEDSTLSSWSPILAAGSSIGARLDSVIGFTWITLQVEMEKS